MKLEISLEIHEGAIEDIQTACALLVQTAMSDIVEKGEDSNIFEHLTQCGSVSLYGEKARAKSRELITLKLCK